jgi:hypothetical protein
MRVKELFAFIQEREAIYQRRAAGQPKPWTKDKILSNYRFCNMYRENDTVTKWIADHWRTPNAAEPDLWFAMTVARLLNNTDALSAAKYPVPWTPKRSRQWRSILLERQKIGFGNFNAAYRVVSGPSFAGVQTVDYLADHVLPELWRNRTEIRPRKDDTLATFNERLRNYRGMGSFIAAQIIADMKYVEPLKSATDFWSWAAPGPGSRKGLNYVCGRSPETHWQDEEWRSQLGVLQAKIDPLVRAACMPRLHAQDLQNCLCEFSKYERTRLGEGRPKQRYDGLGPS